MNIEHTHSIDDEKYASNLARGAVSFRLDDSVSIKLTFADIRYLISQGVDFNINLDEWSSAIKKTAASIASMGIEGLFRNKTIFNITYGFSYDNDFGKVVFMKGRNKEEDEELLNVLKIELESHYPRFLEEIKTLRYIHSPVELDNIAASKIIFDGESIQYVNNGFKIILDKECTTQIIKDTKNYFDKYAEHTISKIEQRQETRRVFTLDFVNNEGLEMAQKLIKKDSITVDDLKEFVEFFYGEDSFEIF